MALQTYRTKRNFALTPEPRGAKAKKAGHQFVIQKHDATRLHYDLRLELDGVMKSWAVTRGPSLNPGEKRLAVQVEDHPVDYNKFEGTIPEGQYGGGTVMIWDRGTWEPEGDPHKGLAKGHLSFRLDGEKLHGGWHLVRIRGRPGETKANWLLIKAHDEAARAESDPDILEEKPLSVVTGRSIPEIAEGKGRKRVWQSNRSVTENVKAGATRGGGTAAVANPVKSARTTRRTGGAKKTSKARSAKTKSAKTKSKAKSKEPRGAPLPEFIPPSLATLRGAAPTGPGWVHEIKFDGYRIQARLDHGEVRLLTRKGLDWVAKFPNVAEAVAALSADTALIDGEIVVEDDEGKSSFSALQAALKEGRRDGFVYNVFDLLHLDGRDLAPLALVERKAELERLVPRARNGGGTIRYSEHFTDDGALVFQHACKMGLEGIVSKRADAPYRPGRSEAFVKTKCENAQEFVVGGFAPSTAMPRAIGALVAGYYKDGRFTYAGRIGTGYTHAVAKDLWKRLHPLERPTTPFDDIPREERRKDVHWVEPTIVIESNFRGWTADNLVRQAAFKGVREDKPAKEVVREVPAMPEDTKVKSAAARSNVAAAKRAALGKASKRRQDTEIRFTHPDRIYWADAGVTKQHLADYYRLVWDLMAPHVVDRPIALLRCPDGTAGQCFFQKHASAGITAEKLRTVIDSNKRQIIAVEDLDGVLSLVQAGVLEIHVRGSRMDRLDLCDRIVFDLDPGEGVTWADIAAAARDVRDRLATLDLESFVKLSGGKGLHVVLPVEPVDWETTKTFAQALAMAMAADDPKRYVPKMTKSLREGKIFVDYFRNSLEQTSVAAYSTRARAGAPVSVPVTWQELPRIKSANQFTVLNIGKRLKSVKQDPWADMDRVRQKLPDLKTLRRRN